MRLETPEGPPSPALVEGEGCGGGAGLSEGH